ncbi:alpha/beta fold hydrolase [Nocardia seriolae]|uniref:Alpha/beta hydrolase n=1 Tax=Nocardia seriolae TaxID=37332 RepID=A0A0B8N9H3_9NOCA|nr:alpha/beta hydrolase [Nocardia seriolae]APA96904.1 Chloride peroxidase [Nocardia seriolae]MTJ65282.1 alpha/beta fold hydrolase [Nocardia seriolae]MTJ70666.1 alpha/beta fold hydrolase [Nocardia seriolae]MTJ86801.1 alpha/beta fold hydrolase [Nocardia seriolae]MTK30795.1 alpha/beta fold hydrolase [Nocardia seriolae]
MAKFTTWDGLELNYTVWEGEGVPVVLQHGIVADTNANWMSVGVVAALRRAGHHVISLDARGHGRSEKPHDRSRYSWQFMADDLRALFDELGLDRVALVGYSMGGIISLLVASADERVERLAIGGIGCGVVDCGGIDWRVIDAEDIVTAMTGNLSDAVPQARMFRILADALGADREAIATVAQGISEAPIENLGGITIPALVLAGDADPFAAEPERLAAALPDARCVVVPGDHLAAVAEPGFSAALVDFLK